MTAETFPAPRPLILVADDDPGIHEAFQAALGASYDLLQARSGQEALTILAARDVNLILLDIRMPGMDGIEVLRQMREVNDDAEVIVVSAVRSLKTAVEAIKLGAFDYVTKPFDVHEILALIKRVLEKQALVKEVLYLRAEVDREHLFDNLVGKSPPMQAIHEIIHRVADNNATVLLTGESGTGKEVLARTIHARGNRAPKPFVAVNCAAIPAELLESELFGHQKGAFTGAIQTKIGKFELANGGTLFLDEIGGMRIDLQAKILRAIQEREIERVGGTRTMKIDLRVIAATNRDLKKMVEEGLFREDLYYRLNVVPIELPPLRKRREDIEPLVHHFLAKYNREFNRRLQGISPAALQTLRDYDWPGNVRELENMIERAVALASGEVITRKDLPLEILLFGKENELLEEARKEGLALREAREKFEALYIISVMERVQWNQTEAGRILGLHRNTLAAKLERLGIREPEQPTP